MTDRHINFRPYQVRAAIEGRLSQTRLVLNPQPEKCSPSLWPGCCRPYYAVGDRLYVREAWNIAFKADLAPGETLQRTSDECAAANGGFACSCGDGIVYRATGAQWHPEHGQARWRPSIHMPRWASRLTLIVTDVRVQRLQEISEADAASEGVAPLHEGYFPYGLATFVTTTVDGKEVPAQYCPTARLSFERLWNSLHGPDAWSENPWVCALTFRVIRANIDSPEAAQ